MRNLYLFVLPLSVLSAAAVTIDVERMPAPSHADREVSENVALPANRLDSLRGGVGSYRDIRYDPETATPRPPMD